MDSLTKKQAYSAMYVYLKAIYDRTGSDDIGALLGGMSLLADGGTVDPAAWADWEHAMRQAVEQNPDMGLDLRTANR